MANKIFDDISKEMTINLSRQINVLINRYLKTIKKDESLNNALTIRMPAMIVSNMLVNLASNLSHNNLSEEIPVLFREIVNDALRFSQEKGYITMKRSGKKSKD